MAPQKKYIKDKDGKMVEVPDGAAPAVNPNSVAGAAVNLKESAVQGVKDFASVVSSPAETAKSLGSRIVGDVKSIPAGAVNAAKNWAKEGIAIGDKVGGVLPWAGKTAEAVEAAKGATEAGGIPAGIGVGLRKTPGLVFEAAKDTVGGIVNEDVRAANRAVGQGIIDVASTAATGKVKPKAESPPAGAVAAEPPAAEKEAAQPATSTQPLPFHGTPTATSAESDPMDADGSAGQGGPPPATAQIGNYQQNAQGQPETRRYRDPNTGDYTYSLPGGNITVKGGAEKITREPGEQNMGGYGARRPAKTAGSGVASSTGGYGAYEDQKARLKEYHDKLFQPVDEANRYKPTVQTKFRNKEDEVAAENARHIEERAAKNAAQVAKDNAIAAAQNEEVSRNLAIQAPRIGVMQQELVDRQAQTGIDQQRADIEAGRAGVDQQKVQSDIAESQLTAQEKEMMNAARAKVQAATTQEEKDAAVQELAALSGNFPKTKDVNPSWAFVPPETNAAGEVVKEGFYYDKNSPTNPGREKRGGADAVAAAEQELGGMGEDVAQQAAAIRAQVKAGKLKKAEALKRLKELGL